MRPRLSIILGWLVLTCAPSDAAVRALLVGIDQYTSAQHLRGSVNDAQTLANALKQAGVTDLSLLTDTAADMATFDQTWQAIVGRAESGDVIMLTFSGHGIRVPTADPRTTPDGFEKGFLLGPYNAKSAPEEILRDEDLYDRFAEATRRGLKVFFVADACHAGAGVRGIDGRSKSGLRFQRYETGSQPLVVVDQATPVAARPQNPDVTVFSATDERLTIQEIVVDEQVRGALSYAVARGLAAVSDSGTVRLVDLKKFVSPMVRELSGNRQIPQFTIPDDNITLEMARQPLAGIVAHRTELPRIGLTVIGRSTPDLDGVEIVVDHAAAELIWDAGRNQVVDANGDVLSSGVGASQLQAAIDARRVVDLVRMRVSTQSSDAGTTLSDQSGGFLLDGDKATITVQPGQYQYATLLDLTANGTVQLIWPIESMGDSAGGTISGPLSFEAPITAPFGADYMITVLSHEPLTDLHHTLLAFHNAVAPRVLAGALMRALADTEVLVGINSLFTCKALGSDGQCNSMIASAY